MCALESGKVRMRERYIGEEIDPIVGGGKEERRLW